MRILFVTAVPFAIEPLGVMLLMAICKRAGHETALTILKRENLERRVAGFRPDVVAYSSSSADVPLFRDADARLQHAMADGGRRVFRIMGGPHATYSPWVLEELKLDAVCQGDGDWALPELLRRLQEGRSWDGIPNIAASGAGARHRELVSDLDALPFPDRAAYDQAVPYSRACGMRSVLTGRGCPYACTYCFNHAYRKLFEDCGPILRRRSVENVIDELAHLKRDFPPLRLVRFSDDTFTHRVDPWLEEFCEKYRARIGVPFYCLMRPNTLTEDTARLLSEAGCTAIGMSIEAGSERLRNTILKRGLSDETVVHAFEIARKYRLNTYGSTMIAIPGSTLEDDFHSLEFASRIRPSAPIFPICTPYRGTQLWEFAVEKGYLGPDEDTTNSLGQRSPLRCYTGAEKRTQLRICYLGPMYGAAPRFARPLIRRLIRGRIPVPVARWVGTVYLVYRIATRIFMQAIPRTPRRLFQVTVDSLRYLF